jgi:hypothetical protein
VSRQPVHLGYDFVPLPRTVQAARREGRLSTVEYDLLGFLYERADLGPLARRAETPRLTVARIAEEIHWEPELDSLTRLLRRLRSEGWFSYRTELRKGKQGGVAVYVFTLYPDPASSGVSEDGIALPEPDSAPAEPNLIRGSDPVRGLSAVSDATPSAVFATATPPAEPNPAPTAPESVRGFVADDEATSSGQEADSSGVSEPATPLPEPDSAPPPEEPVRPPQKDQREANPRSEEGNALGKTTTASERVERNGEGRKPDEAATERLVERVETQRAERRSPFQIPPPPNGDHEREERPVSDPVPAVGEEGYGDHVRALYRAGHISRAEWLERVAAHGRRLRAVPDEQAVLAACEQLVAAGSASWRDESAPALCRYPEHRHSDWLGDGNRLICGTCHPAARTVEVEVQAA